MSTPAPSSITPSSITIHLASQDATHTLGVQVGMGAQPGQVLALSGDLGAGKTTLTQGVAAGLGITTRVTSPTFTLINQYGPGTRRLLLVHIDTYRLGEGSTSALAEASGLGLDEIINDATFADGHSEGAVIAIEWAERVAELLPPDTFYITLAAVPDNADGRTATLTASGEKGMALLQAICAGE